MAQDELWTWFGTSVMVAFAAILGVVTLVGGDVAQAALLASYGVVAAVLVFATYQTISGLLRRRAEDAHARD